MKAKKLNRCLVRAVLLLLSGLLILAACAPTLPSDPVTDAGEGSTHSPESSDGSLTLPPDTPVTEPDPIPPLVAPDPTADLGALVITAYYAAGKVAGKAMVGFPFF